MRSIQCILFLIVTSSGEDYFAYLLTKGQLKLTNDSRKTCNNFS